MSSGWLPNKEQLFAQGLLQSSLAYKYSRRAAEQGVDPVLAAEYGRTLSTCKVAFWLYAPLLGLFAVFALGADAPILQIWGLGQGLLIALLFTRMKAYENADPSKRLRYGLPTGRIILINIAWMLVAAIGFLSLFAGDIHYDPQPVQQTPTTSVSRTSGTSYQ